jgi:hypothetical protein
MITARVNRTGRSPAINSMRYLVAAIAVSVAGAACAQEIRTTVDGDLVDFPDVQPMMVHGQTMARPTSTGPAHRQTAGASVGTGQGAPDRRGSVGPAKQRVPAGMNQDRQPGQKGNSPAKINGGGNKQQGGKGPAKQNGGGKQKQGGGGSDKQMGEGGKQKRGG